MPPRQTPPDAANQELLGAVRQLIDALAHPLSGGADHDLLIEIKTRLDVLQSSVRENHSAIYLHLDQKASSKDLDIVRAFIEKVQVEGNAKDAAQDKQILWSQRMIYIAIGAVGALQLILHYWPK